VAAAAILKIEKSRYRGIIIDRRQIWHDDTFWPSPPYRPLFCRLRKELSH